MAVTTPGGRLGRRCRNRAGDDGRGIENAVFGEEFAQFFQCAADAFAGGVFAGAQFASHLGEAVVLEEPQQHRLAVGFSEVRQGLIEQWGKFRPSLAPASAGGSVCSWVCIWISCSCCVVWPRRALVPERQSAWF